MAKGLVNDVLTGEGFVTSHCGNIDVHELYETLNDLGLRKEFEGDTATDFEKGVRTLHALFVTKLNEPYERHVPRSMAQQGSYLVISKLGLGGSKHRTVILQTQMFPSEI